MKKLKEIVIKYKEQDLELVLEYVLEQVRDGYVCGIDPVRWFTQPDQTQEAGPS